MGDNSPAVILGLFQGRARTMKCIAIEKELKAVDPVALAAILKEEASVVWSLTMDGLLRETWFKQDSYEAVLVFEAPDVDSVKQALDKLPLVREGYISFEVIGLRPYPGLSRLFGAS